MPAMEDLPVVAQNEIKAKSGEAPVIGLAAQKKRVGFLERLANVGRHRKEPEEAPAKREPEFERSWGEMPKAAERPRPDVEAAPRGSASSVRAARKSLPLCRSWSKFKARPKLSSEPKRMTNRLSMTIWRFPLSFAAGPIEPFSQGEEKYPHELHRRSK